VLDVGCGSGVLAIAAARLGAAEVLAIDHSPDACAAAVANVHRNDVDAVVTVGDRPMDTISGRFDVVVANLPTPAIVELAPFLVRCTDPAGTLIVSGFLDERAEAVVTAAAPCAVVESRSRAGWSSIVLSGSP
jgi:ribosomal protein L11 methyltransferase